MQHNSEKELEYKVRRTCIGVNETIHMIANEPSLGLFRVQEHVKKTMPKVINATHSMKKTNDQVKVWLKGNSEEG